MSTLTNCARAQQDKSDSPQYFICLKNGRWRPVDVSPGTFAVMYRGLGAPCFAPRAMRNISRRIRMRSSV